MSTTIAVNDATFVAACSRMGTIFEGSTRVTFAGEGQGFRLRFTGTSFRAETDVSHISGQGYGPGYYPVLRVQTDWGRPTYLQLTSSSSTLTFAEDLAPGTHLLEVTVAGLAAEPAPNRWLGYLFPRLTSLEVDDGATISAGPEYTRGGFMPIGDSIPAGHVIRGPYTTSYAAQCDAYRSYTARLARHFDMPYWPVLCPGQGFEVGNQSVPALPAAIAEMMDEVPRDWSVQPRLIYLAEGTNSGLSDPEILEDLLGYLATQAPDADIVVQVPPNRTAAANITTAANNFGATLLDFGADFATAIRAQSHDLTHPHAGGHARLFSAALPTVAGLLA